MIDGQYTKTVYTFIKDGRLSDAMGCLEPVLEVCRRKLHFVWLEESISDHKRDCRFSQPIGPLYHFLATATITRGIMNLPVRHSKLWSVTTGSSQNTACTMHRLYSRWGSLWRLEGS